MTRLAVLTSAAVLTLGLQAPGVASAAAADGRDAAAVVSVVKDVCLPLLTGAKDDAVAKRAGLKDSRDGLYLPVDGKRRIMVDPPGGANPHVCSATVVHQLDQGQPIVAALSAWASRQSPPLQPLKQNEKSQGPLYQLTTSSWSGTTPQGQLAVVYSDNKTPDGKPVEGKLDQASLTVALTPAAS